MKNLNSNRKTFLKNSLVALAAVVTAPLSAKNKTPKKMVKMLTADGKLVEVDSEIVQAAQKKKVSSKEILNWRTLKG